MMPEDSFIVTRHHRQCLVGVKGAAFGASLTVSALPAYVRTAEMGGPTLRHSPIEAQRPKMDLMKDPRYPEP
jgi:hypothetical protein